MASAALVIGTMPAPLGAQPAPAPVAAPDQTQQGEQFSSAQLEALLAPIALYPDTLLTQLLMATTNPLEIVAASRWLAQGNNRDLKGKALEDALRSQPWDPAVKSLVPFPQVLEMLNQQLEWTQQLGYAMQNQQAEVFDAIQRLRARAQSAGTLQSTPQQIVRTEAAPPPPPGATDPRAQNIVIDPADPNFVYVPSYDPSQVYGVWPYADVPPVYYAPLPGYGYPSALVAGLVFGAGVAVARGAVGLGAPQLGLLLGRPLWRRQRQRQPLERDQPEPPVARGRRRGLARQQSRPAAGWRHGSSGWPGRPAGAAGRSARGGAAGRAAGRASSRRGSGRARRRSGPVARRSRTPASRRSGAATRIASWSGRSARPARTQSPGSAAGPGRPGTGPHRGPAFGPSLRSPSGRRSGGRSRARTCDRRRLPGRPHRSRDLLLHQGRRSRGRRRGRASRGIPAVGEGAAMAAAGAVERRVPDVESGGACGRRRRCHGDLMSL